MKETEWDRATRPDGRESKLPVWAQNRIEGLIRVAAAARRELEEALLKTDPEGSEAVLHPYGNASLGTGPIGLGQHVLVSFPFGQTDGRGNREIDVLMDDGGKWLRLRGGSRLQAEFDSSNVLRVRVVPYGEGE